MGKLHQANRIAFVSNIPTLLTSGKRDDLAVEQIGLFYRDMGKHSVATNAPSVAKGRKFKLVQGTLPVDPDDYQFYKYSGIPYWQHETIEFETDDIVDFTAVKGKPHSKEEIVAIGYDGVDMNKTLKARKGESINFYVHLFGFPAHMVANSTTRSLKRQYYIEPDPESACDCPNGNCNNACEFQKCQIVADKLIAQIQRDKWNKIPITKLIKPTKITKCLTPEAAPTGLVTYNTYEISVPDDHSDAAYGKIQAAYPGKKITRVKVGSVYSVYQLTQAAVNAAPANYTVTGLKTITDCEECPCGFTKVAGAAVYELTIPCDTTAPTVPGQITKVLMSKDVDHEVYQYLVNVTQSEQSVMTAFAAAGCSKVYPVGIQRDICTPDASCTFSWCSTDSCKKAPKTFYITLMDTKCGDSRLPELQAAYPGSDVQEHIVGTCVRQYKMTVMSNCIEEGCSKENYVWEKPDPFAFTQWDAAPDTAPQTGCACGVWLEGARFIQPVTEATFPLLGYDYRMNDPVHIRVSQHSEDFTQPLANSVDIPFTILQEADYPINFGRGVVEVERESMGYFLKQYDFHPVIREKFLKKFNAKPDQYYDEYQLRVRHNHRADAGFGFTGPQEIIYRFFFPIGEGKQFESVINKLVAASPAANKVKQIAL